MGEVAAGLGAAVEGAEGVGDVWEGFAGGLTGGVAEVTGGSAAVSSTMVYRPVRSSVNAARPLSLSY